MIQHVVIGIQVRCWDALTHQLVDVVLDRNFLRLLNQVLIPGVLVERGLVGCQEILSRLRVRHLLLENVDVVGSGQRCAVVARFLGLLGGNRLEHILVLGRAAEVDTVILRVSCQRLLVREALGDVPHVGVRLYDGVASLGRCGDSRVISHSLDGEVGTTDRTTGQRIHACRLNDILDAFRRGQVLQARLIIDSVTHCVDRSDPPTDSTLLKCRACDLTDGVGDFADQTLLRVL